MHLIKGKIIIVLRQSLKSNMFGKNTINGIIYDECHDASRVSEYDTNGNMISGQTYDILMKLQKNHNLKYRIGFSATPLTSDKKQNDGILKLYGENDKINYLYKMSITDGINAGYLSKPNIKYLSFNGNSNVIKNLYKMCNDNNNENIMKLYDIVIDKIIEFIDSIINQMIYKKGIIWFPDVKSQMFFYNIIKNKFKTINVYYSTSHYFTNDKIFTECESNALMIACLKKVFLLKIYNRI
jgi:hypothetical protein